ncbi:MAG TPA: two-component regulator propeller domain-containing protein [Balneolales bacterium]|nr:two-component regulator propeller domain-containing protein [Balneolales bacterium]
MNKWRSRLLRGFFLTCLGIVAYPLILSAQSLSPAKSLTQFDLVPYQTRDGLPQNSVTTLLQDKRGYLWVGTYNGLARFDGLRFESFSDPAGLLNNSYIYSLIEDQDSTIWIGTVNNGLFRMKNGRISRYTKFRSLMSDDIKCLALDWSGALWIGTYGDGLLRIHNDSLKHYYSLAGIQTLYIDALLCDSKGNVWVGSRGSGLYRFDNDHFDYYGAQNGLTSNHIRDIKEDQKGRLWIATSGDGLYVLTDNHVRKFTTADGLTSNAFNALTIDEAGTVWIGTQGNGLDRYASHKFSSITTRDGLTNDVIGTLLVDRSGNLWIGTLGGGLLEMRKGKFTTYTTVEGLSNNNIWTIYEDADHRVWIGTNGGGVDVLKNGKIVRYITTKDGLSNNFVRSIYGDSKGNIWVSTYGGLNRIHGDKITNYTTKDGLSDNIVLSLYEDSRRNLWIGTSGGGLDRFDHGSFTHLTVADGLTNNYIRAIQEDDEHRLWLGTGGGGICIVKNGKVIKTITKEDGLPSDVVVSFHEDENHVMWVGTHGGGLVRIKNDSIAAIQMKDGLPDNVIFTIFEDHGHRFWMSSNKGIFSISRDSLNQFADGHIGAVHPRLYDTYDGLKSTECNGSNQPAGWQSDDGSIWFPTVYGAAQINPADIGNISAKSPIYVDRVIADRNSVLNSRADTLQAEIHDVEFHYTSPNLSAAEKVRYKYRLVGYDHDWINAGNRRVAYYTNLPYGQYTFQVLARNHEGIWSARPASYQLFIPTPFYLTTWAYGSYMFLLFGALYGFMIYQNKQTRKKEQQRFLNEQLRTRAQQEHLRRVASEARMREKEREMELQTKDKEIEIERRHREMEREVSRAFAQGVEGERNRIALELHDEILGILSRIMRSAQSRIRHAKQNGQSNDEFIEQIQDLLPEMDQLGQEIRTIMDDMRPAALDFFSLTESLEDMLNKHSGSADYPMRYDIKSEIESTGLDQFARVTVYRIMQEAIGNSVEHGKPSFIELHIHKDDQQLIFELRDDGTGFDISEAFNRIKNRTDRGGHGLMNMIYRASTISADITWLPREPNGTIMKLTIPLISSNVHQTNI